MSRADGIAFGKPFRPGIALTVGGGLPTINTIESLWNSRIGNNWNRWLDQSEGTIYYIWFNDFQWKHFYRDEDRKPSSPTNPNDSNYNWGSLEQYRNLSMVQDGRAKVIIRIKGEGKGHQPNWFENLGYIHNQSGGSSQKPVISYQNPGAVQELKDFFTAFAARINGQSWFGMLAFAEDRGGNQVNEAVFNDGRAEVWSFANTVLTQHHIWGFQSAGVKQRLGTEVIGQAVVGPKPGFGSCGSSGAPLTQGNCCDCGGGGFYGYAQQFNGTLSNPPGGAQMPVWISIEPNETNVTGSNTLCFSPWGCLPDPAEGSSAINPATGNPYDMNPSVYFWYCSGPQRRNVTDEFGSGTINHGVIPSMIVTIADYFPHSEYVEAFNRFGASGRKMVPALPYGWLDDDPPPSQRPTTVLGYSQTDQWLQELILSHPSEQIVAVISGNADVDFWASIANMSNAAEESYSTSNEQKEEAWRVVLQCTHTGPAVQSQIKTTVDQCLSNMRTIFTNATEFVLVPVTGGPNDGLCPSSETNNINGSVAASYNHPIIKAALDQVASENADVIVVDSNVDDCSWYSDGRGHINTAAGRQGVAEDMWDGIFLGISPPDPPDPPPDTNQVVVTQGTMAIDSDEPTLLIDALASPTAKVFDIEGHVPFAAEPDTEAPSVPELSLGSAGSTTLYITWPPSSDNASGVGGYDLYLDDSFYIRVQNRNYTFENLENETEYKIEALAFDNVGNNSALSSPLFASTTDADAGEPPEISATAVSAVQINIKWTPSRNRSYVRFRVYRDNVLIKTTDRLVHSVYDLGPETQYKFEVDAIDSDGNSTDKSRAYYVTTDRRGRVVSWTRLDDN